jgi:hypothetical protein
MADPQGLDRNLQRINLRAWGLGLGLLLGIGVFVATNVLVLKGGPDVGAHLGRLSQIFPGYEVSFTGSLIGFVYAFVVGYAIGRLIGPRRPLEASARKDPLHTHVRINGHAWGLAIGLLLGIALFAITNVLVARKGEHVGELLRFAGLYLPGYEVTFPGSLVGFLWLALLGYAAGRLIGVLYNASVRRAEA